MSTPSDSTAPAPLAPPEATLTLTAPEAPAAGHRDPGARGWRRRSPPRSCPSSTPRSTASSAPCQRRPAGSPEFAAQAENVRTMGDADIRKAAETSNRMLDKPVRALKEGGLAQGSAVGKTLLELRRTVEDLDPSQAKGAPAVDGLAALRRQGRGLLPQVPVRPDASSTAILHSLRNGQDELTKDNVSLNLEKTNLWSVMGRLNQYVYVAERLDAKLTARDRRARAERPRGRQDAEPGRARSTSGRSTRTCSPSSRCRSRATSRSTSSSRTTSS